MSTWHKIAPCFKAIWFIVTAAITFFNFIHFSVAAQNNICIVEVPFPAFSRESSLTKISPGYVRSLGNFSAPVVQQGTIFWPLSDNDPTFLPPYEIDYKINLYGHHAAANGKGLIVAIGGDYQPVPQEFQTNSTPDRFWKSRLFVSKSGGKFELLSNFKSPFENPHRIRWDSERQQFIITVLKDLDDIPGPGSVQKIQYSFDGNKLELIPDHLRFSVATRAGLNQGVIWIEGARLSYRNESGEIHILDHRMFDGLDFSGWQGLYYSGKNGWYFAAGADGDTAFRIEIKENVPKIVEKRIFLRSSTPANGFLNWLFGFEEKWRKKYQANSLTRLDVEFGVDFIFSLSSKRLFDTRGRLFLDGDFVSPDGYPTFSTLKYLGESTPLKAPIFVSSSGDIYFFKNDRYVEFGNIGGDRLVPLRDLKQTQRSFVVAQGSVYEIVPQNNTATLHNVQVGTAKMDFFSDIREVSGSNNPILFTRSGLFEIQETALAPLWHANDRNIDITGHTTPTQVDKWGGVLFSTTKNLKDIRFMLATTLPRFCTQN